MPRNILKALDKYVVIKKYVDSNHTKIMGNRRSHSGINIYVNNAPIIGYSKRQNTVEDSIFGSDFFHLVSQKITFRIFGTG